MIITGTNANETLTGTNDADLISGLGGFDNLFGNGGNDTLVGGAGEDFMSGGQGNDTFDGTAGPGDVESDLDYDTASYREETGGQGVVVNLVTSTGTDTYGNQDTYIDIEDVRGSAQADSMTGSEADESFHGMAGDDTIDGGGGYDEIRYNNEPQYGATSGIIFNFATGEAIDGFGDTNTFSNFESVRGTSFADTFIGDGNDNRFRGLVGNDTIDGGEGNDTIDHRRDTNYGGNAGIVANLSSSTVIDGYGNTDTLTSIENVIGTWTNDVITGDSQFNSLRGEGGNDTLKGGGGDDDLMGGRGFDTAIYQGKLSDYVISFNPDGYIEVMDKWSGQDGWDFVFDVEQFVFSDATLQGSQLSSPYGLSLSSSRVTDNGGAGTVVGTLSEADPNGDALSFSLIDSAGGRFTLDGSNLVVANGGLLDFERGASHRIIARVTDSEGNATKQAFIVSLSDVVSEKVTGTAGSERIFGGKGNDKINAESGNDWLGGGIGNDALTGGRGKDAFVFDTKPNKKTNLDKVTDFNVKDDSFHLDNAIFRKLGKGSEDNPGKLKAAFFTIGTKAVDANDHIVYDKSKGVLYYDEDGSGSKAAVAFASLRKNLKMTAKDFFVI